VTSGKVYKQTPPSDPVVLNGSTLCGMTEPVTYIVLSQSSPRGRIFSEPLSVLFDGGFFDDSFFGLLP